MNRIDCHIRPEEDTCQDSMYLPKVQALRCFFFFFFLNHSPALFAVSRLPYVNVKVKVFFANNLLVDHECGEVRPAKVQQSLLTKAQRLRYLCL